MLGCLRRLGCLVAGVGFVAVLVMGAYYTRHRWVPFVRPASGGPLTELPWAPLTSDGARRARAAIAELARADGPVFANVAGADFAALVFDLATGGSAGDRPLEAAIRRRQVLLRTRLRLGDLGADRVPLLGRVAGRTATVVAGGTLEVVRPGVGAWLITAIDVDAIALPGWAVPRVARVLAHQLRRTQDEDGALTFALPAEIADVRVGASTITLYKAIP